METIVQQISRNTANEVMLPIIVLHADSSVVLIPLVQRFHGFTLLKQRFETLKARGWLLFLSKVIPCPTPTSSTPSTNPSAG